MPSLSASSGSGSKSYRIDSKTHRSLLAYQGPKDDYSQKSPTAQSRPLGWRCCITVSCKPYVEAAMTSTLDQLRREWSTPCPSLTAVRERYFAHIKTDRYLLQEISSGHIKMRCTRLHDSIRAERVVYLNDLAEYLDSLVPTSHGETANVPTSNPR